MIDERAGIDAGLVRRMIASQFPQWAGLPVTPVEVEGVRQPHLPARRRHDCTAADRRRSPPGRGQGKRVAAQAGAVPAGGGPAVLTLGEPGEGHPFPWSVRGWLPGATADPGRIGDLPEFARATAGFLGALQ